ncbi:MAG: hypothetical protein AAF808_01150 [Cyanobacteria bacterium P01_D01_bin.2]
MLQTANEACKISQLAGAFSSLLAFRNVPDTPNGLTELADRVFSLVMMGDDRVVQAAYSLGELAHERTNLESG